MLPILFEGEVKAVIELASFLPFSTIHQTFLDQLAESIGVVLNMIQANMRTEELLEQSQKLTQELQSQSEELRRQQEELKKSNTELEQQARSLRHRAQGPKTAAHILAPPDRRERMPDQADAGIRVRSHIHPSE